MWGTIKPFIESRETSDQERPNTERRKTRLTAGSIIGDEVENNEKKSLGTIKDLMVNVHTGRIEYVVIATGGFLGLGGKLFALPFKDLAFSNSSGKIILDRPVEYFRNFPGFDKSHWPDTNSHRIYHDGPDFNCTPLPCVMA